MECRRRRLNRLVRHASEPDWDRWSTGTVTPRAALEGAEIALHGRADAGVAQGQAERTTSAEGDSTLACVARSVRFYR